MSQLEPTLPEVKWFPVYGFEGMEISTEGELRTWREVEGWPGYEISDRGELRSWRTKKGGRSRRAEPLYMRVYNHRKGKEIVALNLNGVKQGVYIHRLVALAFIPNPEGLDEVIHIDGDTLNNQVANLKWVTRQRLTDEDVAKIREASSNGEKSQALAARYGVTVSLISRIIAGTRRNKHETR